MMFHSEKNDDLCSFRMAFPRQVEKQQNCVRLDVRYTVSYQSTLGELTGWLRVELLVDFLDVTEYQLVLLIKLLVSRLDDSRHRVLFTPSQYVPQTSWSRSTSIRVRCLVCASPTNVRYLIFPSHSPDKS